MFKREIVMSIPEYLEMVENEKIKKMKKEMSKKQFKKIIVLTLAYIMNPQSVLAFSSFHATLEIIQIVCWGILIGLPIIHIALEFIKASKNKTDYDPNYENENTVVDYTDIKIDRNWHKGVK